MGKEGMTREEAEAKGLASPDPAADLRERLRRLAPGAFPDGILDFERLKGLLGNLVEAGRERFGLVWHGREACLRAMQKRSLATLKPDRAASKNFDETGHLFIEGDNLEVLKLLQKAYADSVKMIYIDPPYNTGKELIYPDRWGEGLEGYLHLTGQKNGDGERLATDEEAVGRRHSNWLSMMWPRLFLARNLLREDGVIFISIDETEHAHLRMLCDSIFGEDGFIGSVAWKKTSGDNTSSFAFVHDNILIYGKGNNDLPRAPLNGKRRLAYKNPDNDPRGDWAETDYRSKWTKAERPNLYYPVTNPTGEEICPDTHSTTDRVWGCDQETHMRNEKMNLVWWGPDGDAKEPKKKLFLSEHRGINTRSMWLEHGSNDDAGKRLKELMGGDFFDYPKPVSLVKKMLEIMTPVGDELVLDFFAGSCTTAHAVMDMNARDGGARRFVCVQLPEPCGEGTPARGAGFRTIADLGRERIRRAGARIAKEKGKGKGSKGLDLGFRAFRLDRSNFKIWDEEHPGEEGEGMEELKERILGQVSVIEPGASDEDLLHEILLKEGYPPTARVETLEVEGRPVHSLDGGGLLVCLDRDLTLPFVRALAALKPRRAVLLDAGFRDDELKVNAQEIFSVLRSHLGREAVLFTI